MNIWIGGRWPGLKQRKLILGESWWGPEESVHRYVRRWCAGAQPDHFFTRIFNVCSGYHASMATPQQKLDFWDNLAFMNFVYWSVGKTNRSKATTAHFWAAQPDLELFLKVLKPDVVWILGTTQAVYSQPIISKLGIRAVVTWHPRSSVSNLTIQQDFQSL